MFALPDTLHPCPFCGSQTLRGLHVGQPLGFVQCVTCQAQGPLGMSAELAITAWQVRDRLPPRACAWCDEVFQPQEAAHHYCTHACLGAAQDQQAATEARHQRDVARRQAQRAVRAAAAAQRAQQREVERQQRIRQQWEMAVS